MKKSLILLLLILGICYLSAEKLNRKIKDPRSMDALFDQKGNYKYPENIIESVHSNTPDAPQIKIRPANADEEENDDDATISLDLESEEDENDDDDDDFRIRKKKLPKSKTEDIHSFL